MFHKTTILFDKLYIQVIIN